MYYNYQKILSYKKPISCVVDLRGIGKTYAFKKLCLKKGLQTKKLSFIWLRRIIEDVKQIKKEEQKFFGDVGREFPNRTFHFKGNLIKDDEGNTIGELLALKEYKRIKSSSYADVKYIVFDEFLSEDGKFLKDEYSIFLNLIDSVGRTRNDLRIIMLSNSVSMDNPYFYEWGVKKLEKQFTILDNVIIESNGNYKEFKELRENSIIGKLSHNTEYEKYATDNKFMLDDNTNVVAEKPIGEIYPLYNIITPKEEVSVIFVNGIIYVGNLEYKAKTFTFYPNLSFSKNAIYCERNTKWFKSLINDYLKGIVFFKNLRIKNTIMDEMTLARFKTK